MPESVERFVRGISVLRLLGIATLLMIALCIVLSASIALADETAPVTQPVAQPAALPATEAPDVEAIQPDRRMIDQSLAAVGAVGGEDIYEFDFVIEVETRPNPEFSEPSNTQDI
ncbi:MAG TPA: hypothetical protein PLR41_03360 [Alphaproteobacteria bacterium]|nr:hypothetical protein [Alphaproteobacteria bacterium]